MTLEKQYDIDFDIASSGRPWMFFPKVFTDNRGSFSEVLAGDGLDSVKQVNRSTSCQWTVRGCHAQKAPKCQSKLVEALTIPIYDIITDARPDSKTFGLTKAYLLDPTKQNKLFVPHGFLHAFAVPPYENAPTSEAMFMYYCDDTYSKADEVGVNPLTIIPEAVEAMAKDDELQGLVEMFNNKDKLILSEKDTKAPNYKDFMEEVSNEWKDHKKLWYM